MPNKRVLFFMSPCCGGAERTSITIAKSLDENKFDVHFVIVGPSEGDIQRFIPKQYRIHLIKVRNIWCFTTIKIIRLLNNLKPDIVFCSLMYLNLRVVLASKCVGGIKIILRCNTTVSYLRNSFWYPFYRWACANADVMIAQTEEMHKDLIRLMRCNQSQTVTLHNPLDLSVIDEKAVYNSPYNDDNVRFVSVASVKYSKGQDILIQSFGLVRKTIVNAHLYLIGKYDTSDSYFMSLRELIQELDIEEYVHFVGFTDNPYVWVKYSNCFVLSSRREGLPNALIESMYLGKSVVATSSVPIISRIIRDGYNGFIVPCDDVNALCQAMIKSLQLNDFTMTYQPNSMESFCSLFR